MSIAGFNVRVNGVWRFYRDRDQKWIWEHLTTVGEVVERSAMGYDEYGDCMADATAHGYRFLPAPPSTRPTSSANCRHWSFER